MKKDVYTPSNKVHIPWQLLKRSEDGVEDWARGVLYPIFAVGVAISKVEEKKGDWVRLGEVGRLGFLLGRKTEVDLQCVSITREL